MSRQMDYRSEIYETECSSFVHMDVVSLKKPNFDDKRAA